MGQIGHFGEIKFYSKAKYTQHLQFLSDRGGNLDIRNKRYGSNSINPRRDLALLTGNGNNSTDGGPEVLSFSDATWSSSINIAEHKRHGKKPLLEITSKNADDFTMTIYLWAQLGVSPWKMLKKLRSYNLEAKVYPLYLGGRKVGNNKWIISGVSNDLKTFYKNGKPIFIIASVTFKEYPVVKKANVPALKMVAAKSKKKKSKITKKKKSSSKRKNKSSTKSKSSNSSKSKSKKKKRVSSKKSSGYITYTMKKTDTLWSIAKKFYGSGDKYKKIYNANKSLQQGYKLKPGSTIKIPKC